MKIHTTYQLKQQQQTKLAITPEMRQAINILQLSNIELTTYIQKQLVENPMLEAEETFRAEFETWFVSSGDNRKHSPSHSTQPAWMYTATDRKSLIQHLEEQLIFLEISRLEKEICLSLIGNLNEHGYLELDTSLFCQQFQIRESLLEKCISVLQSIEPVGIGSRTLAEYLEIQLRQQKPIQQLAIRIVKKFLPEVANAKWKQIAKELKADLSEVQKAVDAIKRCNPRPNSLYPTTPTQYIYPEVTVHAVGETFQITVNHTFHSKIRINKAYLPLLHQSDKREISKYLIPHYHCALGLIKGVEQREKTIYRITQAILQRQKHFFKYGTNHLKPLTLKEISEDVDLHESTISRAAQNKYIQTPHGLFPFRFFFPTRFKEDFTSYSVKHKLQQFIQQESKTSPLSDQKLTDLLKKEGFQISRRTVTKYREKLGIASSSFRKRYAAT